MSGVLLEAYLHGILLFGIFVFACSEPWSVALLQILIAGFFAAVVWQGQLDLSGPVQRRLVPAMLVLVLLGALQLLSERPVTHPHTTTFFTVSRWATQKAVLLWLSYAALALGAASILQTHEQARRLAWTVLILGVVSGVMGLGFRSEARELLMGFRKLPHPNVAPFGPFVNRDHAAALLAMSGLVGWGLFFAQLSQFGRDRRERANRLALAALTLGLVTALGFCVVKTGSRGGTHAFFMGSWVMGLLGATFFWRGGRRWGAYGALLAGAGLYAYLLTLFPQWRGYVDGQWILTLKWRLSMYQGGWDMLKDAPLLGWGLGAFRFAFPPYQESWMHGFVRHVHSDWLELALQAGVLGLAAYLAGFLGTLYSGLRGWLACPSRELRALAGGALGALLAVSLHMLFEFPFQMPGIAVTLILVACLLCSRATFEGREAASREPKRISAWGMAGAAAFAMLVTILSAPPVFAEFHSIRGTKVALPYQAYHFSRALEWDANPKYAGQLGMTYAALVKDNPAAAPILHRKGLKAVSQHFMRHPTDPTLRRLHQYFAHQARATRS